MKPKYFQLFRAAAALLALPTTIHAQTNAFWDGSESRDWNTGANWDIGVFPTKVPGNRHAVINDVSVNIPLISADIAPPVDIFVGSGAAATNARLDHIAGTAATGDTNWMFVGHNGGKGTYNLGDAAGTGGTFTGIAQGTGRMNATGRLYIGGFAGTGSTGLVNVNTTGALAISSQLQVGTNNSTGTLNIDSGTVTTGDWTEIGNGVGSTGNVNISGGTLEKTGANQMIVGANGAMGTLKITGGNVITNSQLWVGNNNTASDGTLEISGTGVITTNNAFAIGRATGTGKVVMTGGTINKNGINNFTIGGNGVASETDAGGGKGTLSQSAGTINVTGEVWVGQGSGPAAAPVPSVGTYEFSGGTMTNNSWVAVGRGGGTGMVKMTGGTWTKTGESNFIVGANGPGTMTMSAGIVDVAPNAVADRGITWIGEFNTGILTLSSTAEFRTARMTLAPNATGNGTVNLNGGTLRVGQITGGSGTNKFVFNGGQIIATGTQGTFINNLQTAEVGNDGIAIDTQGFTLGSAQNFTGVGTGGLVKTGTGTLSLTGTNTYTGLTQVNAGKLVLVPSALKVGNNVTVADGAELATVISTAGNQLQTGTLTLGTVNGASLGINLGSTVSPAVAPVMATNLQVNGTNLINVTHTKPTVGNLPLISFTNLTGGGSFVKGILPRGVQADQPVINANSVTLNVTRVANLAWEGTEGNSVWNTTSLNWFNLYNSSVTSFANGDPVTFDDVAASKDVILNTTVRPAVVDFNNSGSDYTLNGTGAIADIVGGITSLNKFNGGTVTIGNMDHTYTGVTRIAGGTLAIGEIGMAGAPGPIGAATAAPENIALAGGTLAYTGPGETTDRGFSVNAPANTVMSTLSTANNLTIGGQVTAPLGKLTKAGAGTLTLTHTGANTLGNGPGEALRVDGGTLVLNGSGTQTNTVAGEIYVGSTADTGAALVLENAAISSSSWLALGRGNGTTGLVSSINATNSTIQTANFSAGFVGGIVPADHNSEQIITLNDSTWNNNGVNNIAESDGSTATMTLNGNSAYTTSGTFRIGQGATANGTLILNNGSSLTQTGTASIAIGNNGTGLMTMSGTAAFVNGGDFNVGDLATSDGTLEIGGNATINTVNTFVGKVAGSFGLVTQTGGSFTAARNNDFQIGRFGNGTWNQSAGTVTAGGWTVMGRYAGGQGTLDVSGGTYTQTALNRGIIVGEEGTGVFTISGNALVTSLSTSAVGVTVGLAATGSGTLNLDGGTLVANRVVGGAGFAELNLNGGMLRAGSEAVANFITGHDFVDVGSAGAFIDSNGKNITVTQPMLEDPNSAGGGLTKSGAGTLSLNGANTYPGVTTVAAGTLGGTGSVAGALAVDSGASVNPGVTTGTFTAASATFAAGAALRIDIDDTEPQPADQLAVTGTLDITGATLEVNVTGSAALLPYTIATGGNVVGTFANVPAGVTVSYSPTAITITALPAGSAFDTWIGSYPSIPEGQRGPLDDFDNDGNTNLEEFALGGDPSSGSNNAKIYSIVADSDGDLAKELLMTIAVRENTPAFAPGPQPSATWDGVTYSIEGSMNLGTFDSPVSPAAVVSPAVPAPVGYEYRTFTLDASEGMPSKGFLRVKLSN